MCKYKISCKSLQQEPSCHHETNSSFFPGFRTRLKTEGRTMVCVVQSLLSMYGYYERIMNGNKYYQNAIYSYLLFEYKFDFLQFISEFLHVSHVKWNYWISIIPKYFPYSGDKTYRYRPFSFSVLLPDHGSVTFLALHSTFKFIMWQLAWVCRE